MRNFTTNDKYHDVIHFHESGEIGGKTGRNRARAGCGRVAGGDAGGAQAKRACAGRGAGSHAGNDAAPACAGSRAAAALKAD
ncbi:hypothetical protein [Cupriavidus basilensis]|uniref:hypothetical protein n=1 Tax=Cupriavidus basilensis TaxID=68895 RepID=UPI0012DFF700|nr:hypothetical protein [Cupriavidus basilensis]